MTNPLLQPNAAPSESGESRVFFGDDAPRSSVMKEVALGVLCGGALFSAPLLIRLISLLP